MLHRKHWWLTQAGLGKDPHRLSLESAADRHDAIGTCVEAATDSGQLDVRCTIQSPWPGVPGPITDPQRIAAVAELGLVDQPRNAVLQRYVDLCTKLFGVSIGCV